MVGEGQVQIRFDDGFTLLEVLVGVALTSMLALFLMQTSNLAEASYSRIVKRALSHQSALGLGVELRQLFSAAYPLRNTELATETSVQFVGAKHDISFFSVSALGNVAPIVHVSLSIADTRLILRKEGTRDREINLINFFEIEQRHLKEVCFLYYGRTNNPTHSMWQLDWEGRAELPDLVAIATGCDEPANQISPGEASITYRLPVTAAGSCAYDELLQRCRGASN